MQHTKTITATRNVLTQALNEGTWRHSEATRRKMIPYGDGSLQNHIQGRLAEIIFARFIGATLTPDVSWEADRKRGCDVIAPDGTRWHVRSTRNRRGTMLLKPDDPAGYYAFINTAHAPECQVIGWITKEEAARKYPVTSMHTDPARKIIEVPPDDLHPFPGHGYAH